MKKIILILIMFLLTLTSYAKERIEDVSKREKREGLVYVIGEEKAYTGTFIGKYEEDKLHTIEEKGRKEVIYYKGGKLRREIPYKNGIKEGIKKLYYPNGNLEREISYKNGIKEGIEKLYYPSGQLKFEAFNLNGGREGIEKSYYESGELLREMSYSDKKIIKEVYYNKNGNIKK